MLSITYPLKNKYDILHSVLYFRKLDPVDSPKWKPEEVKMYDEVVFQGQQKVKQVLWPRHAVQNTSGAELHKDLKVAN